MKLQLIVIFISSVFFLFNSSCTVQKDKKPNFIIFIADDAAWDDSGAYGNKSIKTPNIDRLAAEGMLFNNAYLTTSSCSPSRCSILTGRYPHNTGAPELHMPLPDNQVMFAGQLQKAGYYTASAGKWHLGPERVEFDKIYQKRDDSGCIDWVKALQERDMDKPFFMWLAASDPHRIYKPNIIPDPHQPENVQVPVYLPDSDSTRKDLAMYYDEIARLDSYIGKVINELEKQEELDNTLIIYMTDNGRPFPRCKTRMYSSGVKTPFIVRWPGKITPGSISNSLVSSIDIAPTFCELAGAEIHENFQGASFAKILKDPEVVTRRFVFSEHNWHDYQAHERMVNNGQFLYVFNAYPELNASPPADAVRSLTYEEMIRLKSEGKLTEEQMDCFVEPRAAEELFDLKNDPFQLMNLADNPEYSEILKEMRETFQNWAKETNDAVPENPTPDKFDRWTGESLKKIAKDKEIDSQFL